MALLRRISNRINVKSLPQELTSNAFINFAKYSTSIHKYESDPAPTFFRKQVQTHLKTMTRVSLEKVFKQRKVGKRLALPEYKFMTDEQLKEAYDASQRHADEILQMPPVVEVRKSLDHVLFRDEALQGLETSRLVFTDITFGKKNSERLIVVREPDGTLQEAEWELRDRMNQIYFPAEGRELRVPKFFEEDRLRNLLNSKEYEYVLDRACLQFEPNNPEYHRITSTVYLRVNEANDFDLLRSTRHFGPLTFYLTWFKIVDNLLLELIETSHIDEASTLVLLYGEMHGIKFEGENFLETFIKEHSNKRGPLELAMQAYKDLEKERQEIETGIKAAHGRM